MEASSNYRTDGGFVIAGVTATAGDGSADMASSRESRFTYVRTALYQPVDNAPPSDQLARRPADTDPYTGTVNAGSAVTSAGASRDCGHRPAAAPRG